MTIEWKPERAAAWLRRVGAEHIKDGLGEEGEALLAAAEEDDDTTIAGLSATLRRVCEWSADDIASAIKEVRRGR